MSQERIERIMGYLGRGDMPFPTWGFRSDVSFKREKWSYKKDKAMEGWEEVGDEGNYYVGTRPAIFSTKKRR